MLRIQVVATVSQTRMLSDTHSSQVGLIAELIPNNLRILVKDQITSQKLHEQLADLICIHRYLQLAPEYHQVVFSVKSKKIIFLIFTRVKVRAMTESIRWGMSVQVYDVEISVRYDGVKWIADYENTITVELFDGIEQPASVIL